MWLAQEVRGEQHLGRHPTLAPIKPLVPGQDTHTAQLALGQSLARGREERFSHCPELQEQMDTTPFLSCLMSCTAPAPCLALHPPWPLQFSSKDMLNPRMH